MLCASSLQSEGIFMRIVVTLTKCLKYHFSSCQYKSQLASNKMEPIKKLIQTSKEE